MRYGVKKHVSFILLKKVIMKCLSIELRISSLNLGSYLAVVGYYELRTITLFLKVYACMQAKQHGSIGFSIYAYDFVPSTNKPEDVIAAQRAHVFFIGW